jgi:hypothetical protein
MTKRRSISITAVLAAALIALAGALEASRDFAPRTRIAQRKGRVAVNLPENCSLGESRFGESTLGIRWPGTGGTEFLGSGGWILRFMVDGARREQTASPDMFDPVDTGSDRKHIAEGCEGGRRYPSDKCDDDGDGSVDEDPFDGIDNDSDGLIDEDFAAVGDAMTVTRAVLPRRGISVTQDSYEWSYGHVRDFIGFTTTFANDHASGSRQADILDLDLALRIGFRIGRADDEARGSDDSYFLARSRDPEEMAKGPLGFAAVSGGPQSPYAALVVLNVSSPEGCPGASALVAGSPEDPDSLWQKIDLEESPDGLDPVITVLAPEKGGLLRERLPEFYTTAGDFERADEGKGEREILMRVGRIDRLKPGQSAAVDWALVFGADEKRLLRNVKRAIETYRGADTDGEVCRWVVPARKAVMVRLDADLSPVWVKGERRPAAAVTLPAGVDEEVEWIRIAGDYSDEYEQVNDKIVVPVSRDLMQKGEPFSISGQMADGTMFIATVSSDEIEVFKGNASQAPDRLPEGSLKIFPNPFVTDLKIDLHVYEASRFQAGRDATRAEGTSTVKIYDVKGRLVRTILKEEFLHPGDYSMGWDGTDEYGAEVSPGVYYCKLQVGERSLTKRVVLLR